MKDIMVWYEDTKDLVEEGNRKWGADFEIQAPYPVEPIYIAETDDGFQWRKEFELPVKCIVWKEISRSGAALENYDTEYFVHVDCLKTGLTEEELNFLNAYRKRFLLIRDKELYIYDNDTKSKIKLEHQSTDFKNFRDELKKLNLL